MRLANVLICQTSLGIGRDLSEKTTKGYKRTADVDIDFNFDCKLKLMTN